ncbi:MAG: hypothetical protein IKH77_03965 [Clostridia bacterium]|nr:hypothetical protein [Clostridia bacterium]
MKKIAALIIALVLVLAACSAVADGISGKSFVTATPGVIEQVNWYTNDTWTLNLKEDGTYELIYRMDAFGAADLNLRGTLLMVFTGSWTDADPEDEETSHRDVTLAPADRIYYTQQGQRFVRNKGAQVLDTANWTDTMTDLVGMDRDAFMAAYALEYVVVVEDPALDPMDSTLVPQIYDMPALAVPTIGA